MPIEGLDERVARSPVDAALDILRRRRWVAAAVFSLCFATAASFAAWLPDLYRATATVRIESQQISEEFVRPSVTADLGTRIQMIREEVMSRARMGDLIARFGLYADLKDQGMSLDDLIERMRRDMGFQVKGIDPQLGRGPAIAFTVSYRGRDPELVAEVTNVLATSYVQENTKIREGQAVRTAEFLKAQLAEVKKEFDAQQQRVSDFNLSHMGELPQQVSANLASLERLNTQLRLNGDNQVRALDRRERLEHQLAEAGAAPASGGRRAASPEADQASRLRQQLDDLKRKVTDQHPDYIRVQDELAEVERRAAAPRQDAPQAAPEAAPESDSRTRVLQMISDADAELRVLRNEELALRQAISGYEKRVENVPKREEEFAVLSRDSNMVKDRYESLLKRYEEAQLAATLEQGKSVEQFRILDAAMPPRAPTAPSRKRLLILGFVLSVALAAGAALTLEHLDTTFHTLDALRAYVTMPMVFSVPVIVTPTRRRRRRLRLALTTLSFVLGLALIVAGSRHLASDNEQLVRLIAGGSV